MEKTEKIIALICAYNEEKFIKKVVHETLRYIKDVIVVDDCSIDKTVKEAEAAGAICLEHDINRGKGGALRTGFEYCLINGYDIVVTIDGDGQHDPSEIPCLLETLKNYDIVIGTRNKIGTGMPPVRIFTNTFCSLLVSLLSFKWIRDTQSGYRAMRVRLLKNMKFVSQRFNLESEILIRAGRRGYRIGECSVKTIYGEEKSKMNPILEPLRFIGLILRGIFWW